VTIVFGSHIEEKVAIRRPSRRTHNLQRVYLYEWLPMVIILNQKCFFPLLNHPQTVRRITFAILINFEVTRVCRKRDTPIYIDVAWIQNDKIFPCAEAYSQLLLCLAQCGTHFLIISCPRNRRFTTSTDGSATSDNAEHHDRRSILDRTGHEFSVRDRLLIQKSWPK
jgi:hypothetical protein